MKLYECVECGAKFDVSQFPAGKQLKCGSCKAVFTVPGDEPAETEEIPQDFFPEDAEQTTNVFKKRGEGSSPPSSKPSPARPAARASSPPPAPPGRRPVTRRPEPEPEPEPEMEEEYEEEPEPEPSRGRRGASPVGRSTGGRGATAPSRGRGGAPASGGRQGQFAVPMKKNNTMLFAGIGAGALVLVAVVGFFVFGKKNGDGDGEGGSEKETAKEERFEKLKKRADDSAEDAFAYAEACELKGDRETAEEYYMIAVKKNKTFTKGIDKLRGWWDKVKKPSCNGDVGKLTACLDWLDRAQLQDEAKVLAGWLVQQDGNIASARKLLGHEQVDGKWYTPEEAEIAKVKASKSTEFSEWDKKTPRERRIDGLKRDYDAAWSYKKAYLDCGADVPYLLAVEESKNYNASLVLDDFKIVVKTLYDLFLQKYGALFDVKEFGATEVNFIYIFESRQRYMDCTHAPYYSGGHFDTQKGQIFIYMDTQDKYETIFHEGIHQLCHALSQLKVKPGDRRNVNMFWFTEGIATFYEGFKRDAAGGFILGEVSQKYMPTAKKLVSTGKHKKLNDIFKISYMDFGRQAGDPNFVMNMYSQSWSIAYFMYTYQGGKYKDAFNNYFKQEVAGKGSYDAAKSCFGDIEKMNAEYEEFVKNLK